MNKEFDSLSELNKEFKKSSLSYSNIYLIDHETMLTKLIHFYFPGRENFEYKKMQLFCKSSMEKWFERRFIKPIIYGDKKKYYTEEQANEVILDASDALDFELMHAFELEVYLNRLTNFLGLTLTSCIVRWKGGKDFESKTTQMLHLHPCIHLYAGRWL